MKKYQIKVYDKLWVYKKTLNPNKLKYNIRFTENINWWQWQINIILYEKINYTWINWFDIIKVFDYNKENQETTLIYTWTINKIKRLIDNNWVSYNLTCIWLASLLTNIMYYDTSYEFNKTWDPANIIKWIIDYFNTKYWWNLIKYSWWYIDNYWSSIDIDFKDDTCLNAIKKVKNITNYYFFIDSNWEVYFKAKPSQSTHKLTLSKDIITLESNEDIESIKNKLILTRNSWTTNYEDTTSQWAYGIREKRETKTDLKDITTANEYWNKYILQNKDYKLDTTLVVNNKYDIKTIHPWETVRVLNIDYSIENVQILKISYAWDMITLYLDKYISFWESILNIN